MHWLIPVVSHTLSCLYGWIGNSITPAALLVSLVLVAAQSTHHWGGFYIIFAVFFLASNGIAIASRYSGKRQTSGDSRRNVRFLVVNALIPAILVLSHQYYLKQRLALSKWFLLAQAPVGCLPVPSRSITNPWRYSPWDALGNQLPWGIVASYGAALSSTLSSAFGDSRNSSITNILVGSLGALVVGITAACALPMCDGRVEGAEAVMETVDRSVAWNERASLQWTDRERYTILVSLVTLVGTIGVITEQVLATRLLNGANVSERTTQANGKPRGSNRGLEQDVTHNSASLASFYRSVVVTGSVVIGMAVWSFVGAQPREEGSSPMPGGLTGIL